MSSEGPEETSDGVVLRKRDSSLRRPRPIVVNTAIENTETVIPGKPSAKAMTPSRLPRYNKGSPESHSISRPFESSMNREVDDLFGSPPVNKTAVSVFDQSPVQTLPSFEDNSVMRLTTDELLANKTDEDSLCEVSLMSPSPEERANATNVNTSVSMTSNLSTFSTFRASASHSESNTVGFPTGSIVWAKVDANSPFWPGCVCDATCVTEDTVQYAQNILDSNKSQPWSNKKAVVFFYGSAVFDFPSVNNIRFLEVGDDSMSHQVLDRDMVSLFARAQAQAHEALSLCIEDRLERVRKGYSSMLFTPQSTSDTEKSFSFLPKSNPPSPSNRNNVISVESNATVSFPELNSLDNEHDQRQSHNTESREYPTNAVVESDIYASNNNNTHDDYPIATTSPEESDQQTMATIDLEGEEKMDTIDIATEDEIMTSVNITESQHEVVEEQSTTTGFEVQVETYTYTSSQVTEQSETVSSISTTLAAVSIVEDIQFGDMPPVESALSLQHVEVVDTDSSMAVQEQTMECFQQHPAPAPAPTPAPTPAPVPVPVMSFEDVVPPSPIKAKTVTKRIVAKTSAASDASNLFGGNDSPASGGFDSFQAAPTPFSQPTPVSTIPPAASDLFSGVKPVEGFDMPVPPVAHQPPRVSKTIKARPAGDMFASNPEPSKDMFGGSSQAIPTSGPPNDLFANTASSMSDPFAMTGSAPTPFAVAPPSAVPAVKKILPKVNTLAANNAFGESSPAASAADLFSGQSSNSDVFGAGTNASAPSTFSAPVKTPQITTSDNNTYFANSPSSTSNSSESFFGGASSDNVSSMFTEPVPVSTAQETTAVEPIALNTASTSTASASMTGSVVGAKVVNKKIIGRARVSEGGLFETSANKAAGGKSLFGDVPSGPSFGSDPFGAPPAAGGVKPNGKVPSKDAESVFNSVPQGLFGADAGRGNDIAQAFAAPPPGTSTQQANRTTLQRNGPPASASDFFGSMPSAPAAGVPAGVPALPVNERPTMPAAVAKALNGLPPAAPGVKATAPVVPPVVETKAPVPVKTSAVPAPATVFTSQGAVPMPANVAKGMATRAKVEFNQPPIATKPTNPNTNIQANDGSPRAANKRYEKPLAAVVTFGFGGKMALMVPKMQQFANPLLVTPSDLAKPYRNGPVNIMSLQHICARAADRNHDREAASFLDSLSRFSSPLDPNKNAKASIEMLKQFITQRIDYPASSALADSAFSVGCSRDSLTSSEKSLWSVLYLLLETRGSISNSVAAGQSGSIEKRISNILLGIQNELNTTVATTCPSELRQQFIAMAGAGVGPQEKADAQVQVENLLLLGMRKEALDVAVKHQLWGLAILLGSVLGPQSYQSVVKDFAEASFPDGAVSKTLALVFSNQGSSSLRSSTSLTRQNESPKSQVATLWRRNLSAILCNKSTVWETLCRELGDRVITDSKDFMAAHISYLSSGLIPFVAQSDVPCHHNRFALVGCDTHVFHATKRFHDAISVSAMRMTEILEFALSLPNDLDSIQSAPNNSNSIGKALSGFFGFGGSSQGSTMNSTSGTGNTTNVSTSGEESDSSRPSHAQIMLFKRSFCTIKLRFAFVLAEYGFLESARNYAIQIKDFVSTVGATGIPPTSKQQNTSQIPALKPFPKKFVEDLDAFVLRTGVALGIVKPDVDFVAATMATKTAPPTQNKPQSGWSITSALAVAAKELVDGGDSSETVAVAPNPTAAPPTATTGMPPPGAGAMAPPQPMGTRAPPTLAVKPATGPPIPGNPNALPSTIPANPGMPPMPHGRKPVPVPQQAQGPNFNLKNPNEQSMFPPQPAAFGGGGPHGRVPPFGSNPVMAPKENTYGGFDEGNDFNLVDVDLNSQSNHNHHAQHHSQHNSQHHQSYNDSGHNLQRSSSFSAMPPQLNKVDKGLSKHESFNFGRPDHASTGMPHASNKTQSEPVTPSINNTAVAEPTSPSKGGAANNAPNGDKNGNNPGLVGALGKKLMLWWYPEAHDADQNMGDKLEAYFDKDKKRWIFPGEEDNASDPAAGPPPTSMPVAPKPAMGGGPSGGPSDPSAMSAGPSSSSNNSGDSGAYDPLAALMAPPSRPATYGISQVSMNDDPMGALMAPPMRMPMAPKPAGGADASSKPPAFNIWKPPAVTATTAPIAPFGMPVAASDDTASVPPISSNEDVNQRPPEAFDSSMPPPTRPF